MRSSFWLTAALGVLLALLGMFVFSAPLIPGVLGERVDDWYGDQAMIAAVLGLAIGAVSAVLAQRRLHHRPHENAIDFLSRVGSWGFWTLMLMVVLAAALTFARAATAAFVPLAPVNRFLALAASGKFLGVLGAGAAAAALTYAALTRAPNWGGRFALLPARTVPGRSLKHGA
jgi:hypothetical protein